MWSLVVAASPLLRVLLKSVLPGSYMKLLALELLVINLDMIIKSVEAMSVRGRMSRSSETMQIS
jgi:hypothetical protein